MLEKEAGFNEKSMFILRSFIEFKALMFKKVLKDAYIDSYRNYIESDFPKIGDFAQIYGLIDYMKKVVKVDKQLFERKVIYIIIL